MQHGITSDYVIGLYMGVDSINATWIVVVVSLRMDNSLFYKYTKLYPVWLDDLPSINK